MKTYGQYCPIAKSVEVLGERWSILVMRELLIGSTKFNDLARGLPGMSRTMLSKRLREFEAAGLVEKLDGEYHLTPPGQELRPIVFAMGAWGERWLLQDPDPDELDPVTLMWWSHGRIDTSSLPDRRVVISFELQGRPERFWIVVETVGCSVCMADPGFDVDVTVRADLLALYQVWYGKQTMTSAIRDGRISFAGDPALARRMPEVLDLFPADLLGVEASSSRPVWAG